MFTATLLLSFLAVITQVTCTTDCSNDDCMLIYKCPEAMKILRKKDQETAKLIQRAKCGIQNRVTKVCCSLFKTEKPVDFPSRIEVGKEPVAPVTPATTITPVTTFTPVTTVKPITPIPANKDHPNLRLLPDSCGDIYESRITSGILANMYEYPWMALIGYYTDYGTQFQCSGSVINSRYILTAAHCVVNLRVAGVRIGEYDMRYAEDCDGNVCESYIQDIQQEEIIYHQVYKGYPDYADDIALIRLKHDINFDRRNAQAVCLPVSKELREASIVNKMATVTGWGLTEHNTVSSILRKVIIPVNSPDVCAGFYRGDFNENSTRFCAGNEHKDSCRGDSGGPLILENFYRGLIRYVQFGIVSNGGAECGRTPGIYTDVRKYMDWILDTIKE
ncbi:venom protease-like [Epargyreus clarus]|uniref:venom protease-like n=1 Tax=Epargyreus clarus TaxID=520877 RepID=UPI003C2D65EB